MVDQNDAEEQSGSSILNTTMTISTPDIVSSCDLTTISQDSFGILSQSEMADFSVMTNNHDACKVKKACDETYDATGSATSAVLTYSPVLTLNSTVVLGTAGPSHNPLPESQCPPHLVEEINRLTPSHFQPGSVPCHSTPLTDLSECLDMVPHLAGEDENPEHVPDADQVLGFTKSNCVTEAASKPVVPSSNCKVKTLRLAGSIQTSGVEKQLKPKLGIKPAYSKKPLMNPSVSALRSSGAFPKLPLIDKVPKHTNSKNKENLVNNLPSQSRQSSTSKEKLLPRKSPKIATIMTKTKAPKTAQTKLLIPKPTIGASSTTNAVKPPLPKQSVNRISSALNSKSSIKLSNSESSSSSSIKLGSASKPTSFKSSVCKVPKSGSMLSIKDIDFKMSDSQKSVNIPNNLKKTAVKSSGRISDDKTRLTAESKSSSKIIHKSVSNISVASFSRKYSSSAADVPHTNVENTGFKTSSSNNMAKSNLHLRTSLGKYSKSPLTNEKVSSVGARSKHSDNNSNSVTTIPRTTPTNRKTSSYVKSPRPSLSLSRKPPTSPSNLVPRLTVSNSFVAQEVTLKVKPSLPPRSLSNVSSRGKKSSSNSHSWTPRRTVQQSGKLSITGHGSTRLTTSSSREAITSSVLLNPNSSQPDLVQTSTTRSDLLEEITRLQSCLAAKTREVGYLKTITKNNIVGFDALAIVVQNLLKKTEQMETIKLSIEAFKNRTETLQIELENSKLKHTTVEDDFNNLLHQLGGDIETMCRKHEEEKICMINSHRCQLDALIFEHQEALRKRKTQHVQDLTLTRDQHQTEILNLNQSNQMIMETEKSLYYDREAELINKFKDGDKKHLEKIQHLESKISAMVISLMNGPDHRDGVMAEMQNEIDSLRAVVEMKKDEARTNNEEKSSMCQKLESFEEMKDKVKNLSSQVEDLKELLVAKKSNERKLDAELQNLQESMKKQSREKRRLSMEKEQLEWRVKQRMPLQRCLLQENQSQSFSGETQHSRRNFKNFHIRSPSHDCTDPIPLQDFSSPSSSSTPLVLDYRTSRASVSYQLDLSGSRTPDSAWNGRQRRLDTGLEDRQ